MMKYWLDYFNPKSYKIAKLSDVITAHVIDKSVMACYPFMQPTDQQSLLSEWSERSSKLSQKMRALISRLKTYTLWVLGLSAVAVWTAEKIHAQIPVWCTKDILQDPANNPMVVGDSVVYIAPWSWSEMVDAIAYSPWIDWERNVQLYVNNTLIDPPWADTGVFPWDTIKRVWLSQWIDNVSTVDLEWFWSTDYCPNNNASFDLEVINQVLPLNRTRIDAEQVKDSVIVTGQIASRYNAEKATLQASAWAWFVDTDQSITFDHPDRNTPETLRYAIHSRDLLALLGDKPTDRVYYFRIRNNDIDGSYDYSPIVSLKIDQRDVMNTIVYPNPCQDGITILHGDTHLPLGTLKIYDAQGRLIKQVQNIQNEDIIDMSNELPGIYFIIGNTFSQTFIKQ